MISIIIRLKNSFNPIKCPNGGAITKGNRYTYSIWMSIDDIWNSKIPFAIMLIIWLLMLLPKFTNYMLITEYPQKSPQRTHIPHNAIKRMASEIIIVFIFRNGFSVEFVVVGAGSSFATFNGNLVLCARSHFMKHEEANGGSANIKCKEGSKLSAKITSTKSILDGCWLLSSSIGYWICMQSPWIFLYWTKNL